jgi:hypothetical protein
VTIASDSDDTEVSAPDANGSVGLPCALVGYEEDASFEDFLFECTGMRGGALEERILSFECDGLSSGKLVLTLTPNDRVVCIFVSLETEQEEELENRHLLAPRSLPCGSRLPTVRLQLINTAGKAVDLGGVPPEECLDVPIRPSSTPAL